jgi:NAD(P)-dependent dehydrogenase (short-subunit alcohol dehydrogenase family)
MKGRRVIVTGAASGIGLATAELLHDQGASVVLADRNAAVAESAAERLGLDRALAHTVDVRDQVQVESLVRTALARFGGLDGLVTAAAISAQRDLAETQPDEWSAIIDTSLTGTYLCCRAAIPELRRAEAGAIVTFGSVIGRAALAGFGAYAAAKAGIEAITRMLAIEHARDDIRVNCVVPGSVDTPMMWEEVPPGDRPRAREQVNADQPMGRIGQPRELAEAVIFLLSGRASFITGASLAVDGGLLAKLSSRL